MRTARNILLFTLLALLCSCGYRMGSENGPVVLDQNQRKIAMGGIENPTQYTWLDAKIRSELRDELTRRGWVQWVDKSKADSLIYILVTHYHHDTDVTGEDEETLRRAVTFSFEARILSALDNSVIWESGRISSDERYFSGEQEKSVADDRVTRLGVRELVDRMSQNY